MGTKIGYKDLTEDLTKVAEAQKKDPLEKYSIDIEGTMKNPPAMKVLNVLDGSESFEDRAQFVKELLNGCKVTVYKNDKKIAEIGVTQGMEWWSVDELNADPLAFRYIVIAVYTRFLKKYVA